MFEDRETMARHSNWLGDNRIPDEIKLMILEHTSAMDLVSLLKAYEWTNDLWNRYPKQLFPRHLGSLSRSIDAALVPEVLLVYDIRRIRKEYATAMESVVETQRDRDGLQANLRRILSGEMEDLPELQVCLQTILDIAEVVRDYQSLTFRYSNDAWRRIHHIAETTGTGLLGPAGLENTPAINLTRAERVKFSIAFVRVEIYLLTKYWTNAQGQRHMLDMGRAILPYFPSPWSTGAREQFDSCLRYIFDAHRGCLQKTATELNAPEVPARDDLPWVPRVEDDKEYRYKDDGTINPVGCPETDFARRSVSEEQRCLLWLCESGIGPLERALRADERKRRDWFLSQFGRRQSWDTVELRHRVSRYDVLPDGNLVILRGFCGRRRNRHPVKNLYGHGFHQEYSHIAPAWACASAFLTWEYEDLNDEHRITSREGVTVNSHGTLMVLSDTDHEPAGGYQFPYRRRKMPWRNGEPVRLTYGHQYMLEPELNELRFGRMPWGMVGPEP